MLPMRSSVPPLAVTVPLPDNEPATLPQPDRLLDEASAIPPASLILPPAMVICPAVMLIAVLLRVALPIASVALPSLMVRESKLRVAEMFSVSV